MAATIKIVSIEKPITQLGERASFLINYGPSSGALTNSIRRAIQQRVGCYAIDSYIGKSENKSVYTLDHILHQLHMVPLVESLQVPGLKVAINVTAAANGEKLRRVTTSDMSFLSDDNQPIENPYSREHPIEILQLKRGTNLSLMVDTKFGIPNYYGQVATAQQAANLPPGERQRGNGKYSCVASCVGVKSVDGHVLKFTALGQKSAIEIMKEASALVVESLTTLAEQIDNSRLIISLGELERQQGGLATGYLVQHMTMTMFPTTCVLIDNNADQIEFVGLTDVQLKELRDALVTLAREITLSVSPLATS